MITNWKTYRPRLSPAMVVALLALIVALSTPAQAAMERLARGSVGTAQLKDGAVTTPKIRNGAVTNGKIRAGAVTNPRIRNGAVTNAKIENSAVTGVKVRDGSVGLGDLSAAARPRLPEYRGAEFGNWVVLPQSEWTTVARLDLPPGQWAVFGKGILSTSSATCDLMSGGQVRDRIEAGAYAGETEVTVPMNVGQRVVLSTAGSVEIRCIGWSPQTRVGDFKIHAIQVRS